MSTLKNNNNAPTLGDMPPAPCRSNPFDKLMMGIQDQGAKQVAKELARLTSGEERPFNPRVALAIAEFIQGDFTQTGGQATQLLHLYRVWFVDALCNEARNLGSIQHDLTALQRPEKLSIGEMRRRLASSSRVSEEQLLKEFDPILRNLLNNRDFLSWTNYQPLRQILVHVATDPEQFKLYATQLLENQRDFPVRFYPLLKELIYNYTYAHNGRVLPYSELKVGGVCNLDEYNHYYAWCRQKALHDEMPSLAEFSRISDLMCREYWIETKDDDKRVEFPCLYTAICSAGLYPRNREEFRHFEEILRSVRDPNLANWSRQDTDQETLLCNRIKTAYSDGKSSFGDIAKEFGITLQRVGGMIHIEKLVFERGYASTPEQAAGVAALLLKIHQPNKHGSLEQFASEALPATDKLKPIPLASLEAVLGALAQYPQSLRHPEYATMLRLAAQFGDEPTEATLKFLQDTIVRYNRNSKKCAYFLSQTIEELRAMHQRSFASPMEFEWWLNNMPDAPKTYREARSNAEKSLDPYWLHAFARAVKDVYGALPSQS